MEDAQPATVETEEIMPHQDYYDARVLACRQCGGKTFEAAHSWTELATLLRCVACKGVSLVHTG